MGDHEVTRRDEPAYGIGTATYDDDNRLLDAWFPAPSVGPAACSKSPSGAEPSSASANGR